jgi:phosphoglycerate dehydrogenase-like enzyme
MKKILFIDSNHPILHETLINAGFQCDLFWDKTPEELITLLPSYEGAVIRSKFKFNKDILEKATKLKCIGRVGAGMENIDVNYAPNGFTTQSDGAPTQIQLTINFKEIELLTRDRIEQGY